MNIKLKPKDYWATPKQVFSNIERLTDLTFDLDACATHENRKCADYISEEQNTLLTSWGKGRAGALLLPNELIIKNGHLSVEQLADKFGVSIECAQTRINKLNKKSSY